MLGLSEVWEQIHRNPAAEFLVLPKSRYRYRDASHFIGRIVAGFDRHSLINGDRVLIATRNEFVAVTSFLAAILDGLVPIMVTAESPAPKLAALAGTVDARLIVTDQRQSWMTEIGAAVLAPPDAKTPGGWRTLLKSQGEIEAATLELPGQHRDPQLPQDVNELAYIAFTSGTTQSPTGVMISRRNLLANLTTLKRLFCCDPDTRLFNDMMLAHADGFIQGPMLAVACGGCLVRSDGFQVDQIEEWLNRVRQERCTHVLTVPTVWSLIDRYAAHDDYFDAPECSHLISVAAKLSPELWERLQSRFHRPVYNEYGLTETVASALYAGPHPEMGKFDTIGKPIDCEARLHPMGADHEVGELQVRGDNVFMGYWKDPERTRQTFTDDGWLRTGDLAKALPDRSYSICGRIKTIINCGGLLIRPDEIDEVMRKHPSVVDAATVGMPDTTFGEIAVTAVVLDRQVDEKELTGHARAHLEPLKVPKRIVVIESIPRGDAGKPGITELCAMLKETAAPPTEAWARSMSLEKAVFEVASKVFRTDFAKLNGRNAPQDIEGWDSFSHVALILALEERFELKIPVARAAGLKCLQDVVAMIEEISA